MADVDWTNPCARADALRGAYYELISGSRESAFTYLANGVTRTVEYSKGDLDKLSAELQTAETQCAALRSGCAAPRRRAIQFG